MEKFITINRSQLEPSPSTSVVVLPEKNEVRERDANIEDEARDENGERADNLVEDTDVEEEIDNRKRKRPKVSKVWNFFKKSGDKKFAKCLNCGKEYKTSSNTSNLSDHLKRYHPRLLGKPHDYDRTEVILIKKVLLPQVLQGPVIEIFKNEQNTKSPLKLLQEVPTRWNSAYKIIERILKTSDFVNKSLLKIKKAPVPLSIDELTVLGEIRKLLKPFDEATSKVSGAYVTISMIIPLTFGIYNSLIDLKTYIGSEEGTIMCEKLINSVQSRLFLYEKRTVTQMGTLLDPAFKQEGFRIIDNAKAAGQFLENEMLVMLNKDVKEPDSKGSISNDKDDLDSSDRG
ncbi:unnamed protein product [Phaedon cochleariae]|uniref:BED-type domain-containing protein n=1 Tax=Phaedon cochleariae TaxID=80249 RepID=A0A9N9X0M8_PHACE|nr:unnamed protein product [Phaedon cochleariae]